MYEPPNPEELPDLVETSSGYLTLIRCPFCEEDWHDEFRNCDAIEPKLRQHLRAQHGPEVIDDAPLAGRRGAYEMLEAATR